MSTRFDQRDWRVLLKRIREGKCTPFLGAGACAGALPLGGQIAHKWTQDFGYPLADGHELSRVAQFMAIDKEDPLFPKELIQLEFEEHGVEVVPDPHQFLANLPLRIYLTTNYDHFMAQALEAAGKQPRERICVWNEGISEHLTDETAHYVGEVDFEPTPEEPLVFHLHGIIDIPASLVITEDDYLEFLIRISRHDELLPPHVRRVFTGTSLLFLGYAIADTNFRVLFRMLNSRIANNLRSTHISVQLPPNGEGVDDARSQKAQQYLDAYFKELKVRVFWGDCDDFLDELKAEWEGELEPKGAAS